MTLVCMATHMSSIQLDDGSAALYKLQQPQRGCSETRLDGAERRQAGETLKQNTTLQGVGNQVVVHTPANFTYLAVKNEFLDSTKSLCLFLYYLKIIYQKKLVRYIINYTYYASNIVVVTLPLNYYVYILGTHSSYHTQQPAAAVLSSQICSSVL